MLVLDTQAQAVRSGLLTFGGGTDINHVLCVSGMEAMKYN